MTETAAYSKRAGLAIGASAPTSCMAEAYVLVYELRWLWAAIPSVATLLASAVLPTFALSWDFGRGYWPVVAFQLCIWLVLAAAVGAVFLCGLFLVTLGLRGGLLRSDDRDRVVFDGLETDARDFATPKEKEEEEEDPETAGGDQRRAAEAVVGVHDEEKRSPPPAEGSENLSDEEICCRILGWLGAAVVLVGWSIAVGYLATPFMRLICLPPPDRADDCEGPVWTMVACIGLGGLLVPMVAASYPVLILRTPKPEIYERSVVVAMRRSLVVRLRGYARL